MKDAGEYIGIAVIILAISFGCSHCDMTKAKIEIMQKEAAKEAK